MTGEMCRAEVTRDAWPLHFAVADKLKGSVEPFDQYQGPYVVLGRDIRVGAPPYAMAPRGLGIVRLWLISEDGAVCHWYNEANEKKSVPFFWDEAGASLEAAESVI